MTYEILSTPVNSPASLLFKQCLAEIDPENRLLNSAMNEVGGYFLNKTELIEHGPMAEHIGFGTLIWATQTLLMVVLGLVSLVQANRLKPQK